MNYVLFSITAPFGVIVGWGWLGLLFCIGAVRDFRWEPTLVLTAVFRDWVATPRTLWWSPKVNDVKQPIPLWHYSTTLCRAIAYQPNARAKAGEPMTRTQQHEHVHVRQSEDRMLWMFFVGLVVLLLVGPLTGNWWLAFGLFFGLWFSGGFSQLANMLTAIMRGGDGYRTAEHERSAYAQTDPWGSLGDSWLDRHTKK
jgi:hypothetical protein